MRITKDNFDEGAYARGVAWECFTTGGSSDNSGHDDVEIQKIDLVEHDDVDPEILTSNNPWFDDDLEAELLVCLLALDGDEDARAALREIGCTKEDLLCL